MKRTGAFLRRLADAFDPPPPPKSGETADMPLRATVRRLKSDCACCSVLQIGVRMDGAKLESMTRFPAETVEPKQAVVGSCMEMGMQIGAQLARLAVSSYDHMLAEEARGERAQAAATGKGED